MATKEYNRPNTAGRGASDMATQVIRIVQRMVAKNRKAEIPNPEQISATVLIGKIRGWNTRADAIEGGRGKK